MAWVFVVGRSGVIGGVRWESRVTLRWASGVMAMDAIALWFGVGGFGLMVLVIAAKVTFVCRTTFVSISCAFSVVVFGGDTFVCFVFSPCRGDNLLLLAPKGLRRFVFLVMVSCLRSFGALEGVAARAKQREVV